jgi:hypothetical protein
LVLTVGNRFMPWNSRFSDLDWIITVLKCLRKTVHQQADFKFIDVEESWRLFVFSQLCTIRLYVRELQNIMSMKKLHEQTTP